MTPLPAISPDQSRAIWPPHVFARDERPPGLTIRDVGQSPRFFEAERLSLEHSDGEFFVTSLRNGGDVTTLQVRPFAHPETILVEIDDPHGRGEVRGDRRALGALPAFINEYINNNWLWRHNGSGRYEAVDAQWIFEGGYDVGYQAPLRPAVHEPSHTLLIGVQRSGHFVLCDQDSGERRGVLELAQGRGNPDPMFDSTGRIWTIDRDTLVRIEADLTVSGQVLVQPGTTHNGTPMSQFAGQTTLSEDETRIFISRPFSGDIAVFDTTTLELVDRIQIGGEPLEIAVMTDGLVTLEWRTGEYRFTALN